MSEAIIIALITCLFSSGGLVIAILNFYKERKNKMQLHLDSTDSVVRDNLPRIANLEKRLQANEKAFKKISGGVILGLQNDVIIFNALRTNHINGESTKQQEKIQAYIFECSQKEL